jgi:hypothetical protein
MKREKGPCMHVLIFFYFEGKIVISLHFKKWKRHKYLCLSVTKTILKGNWVLLLCLKNQQRHIYP